MIRAVLDANAHVSAAIVPHGYPAKIIQAWRDGNFALITCQAILKEVSDVLKRPHIQKKYKGVDEGTIHSLIEYLVEFAIVTPGELKIEAVSNDPDDNKIIACAVEGEAGYIVTGDPHLKDLKVYQDIQIISPREFWSLLEKRS
ncbi:MAG: putative toxin-antitoxin system toxin component, PIN family [Actinomycetota bacterium]|nr:putative toxin-antitoxin system toxin component, PIN family [Actinomycetota bacterium]